MIGRRMMRRAVLAGWALAPLVCQAADAPPSDAAITPATITPANVATLQPVFSFRTESAGAGQVAAPLTSLRKRVYLAGVVRNTAENLVQWIVDPSSLSPLSPRTAMPVTGISRQEAADLGAYLYAN